LQEKIETTSAWLHSFLVAEVLKVQMLATPDQQISLTDPDARSIARRQSRR
jgi:hypothetical protein